jgi:prepilin peptidase CpaA
MPKQIYLHLLLFALLFIASAFDLRQRRIPNRLLAIGLIGALAWHLSSGNPSALLSTYLAGFAVGLVMFLPLYVLGGMAAGDVKLMATVGAFTGPALAFQISLATYCAGGLMALAIVLAKGRARAALHNVGTILTPIIMRMGGTPLARDSAPAPSVGGMPYALAITLGTLLVLCPRYL